MQFPLLRFVGVLLLALAAPSTHAECRPLDSVPESANSARVVVFGELHGTNESPEFIARMLCSAAKGDAPVVLALEIPVEEQSRIDSFMNSDGKDPALGKLLAGSFWHREHHDGRSSAAMVRLIGAARDLKASGSAVSVLAFAKYDQRPGDLAMADVVASRLASDNSSRVIVLTGSVHGATSVGAPWDPEFKPLGSYLAERHGALTLRMSSGGGSFWACIAGRCEVHTREVRMDASEKRPGISLTGVSGYDGTYFVGNTSASPPPNGGPSIYARPDG